MGVYRNSQVSGKYCRLRSDTAECLSVQIHVLSVNCFTSIGILNGGLVLFCSCFSVLLALRLPRLGEERANLSAFSTFVRFALVWFCLFPLPLGV